MNRVALRGAAACIVAILALAISLWGACAVAGTPTGTQVGGFSRQCIAEPVFGGTVCVYEGNRAAVQSVVLLNGINGDVRDWADQLPALMARFHVVAIDLPGFGASSKGNRLYTVDRYSAVVEFVLGRYALGRVSLVGHSLGGAVALWYAGRHAGRVDRMVVADVPGVLHRLSLTKHFGGDWFDKLLGRNEAPAPNAVERFLGEILERFESFPLDPASVLQSEWARQRVLGGDPARIAAFALAYADFTDVIDDVEAPTLVIWGESDEVATSRTGYVLAARLPHARLTLLPGGHSPMKEQAARFTELMMGHLTAAGLPGASPLQPPAFANEHRIGWCERQSHVVFEGRYDEIRIRHCPGVTIRDAAVGRLEVFESTAALLNTVIASDQVAATVVGSEITATATDVSGDVAIKVSRSRLDLAGVRLAGRSAAVVAEQASNLTFSVSRIESPHTHGHMHGFVVVVPNAPL